MAELFSHGIFKTPVAYINYGNEFKDLNKDLIRDIYDEKKNYTQANRSGVGVWQSSLGIESRYESFNILRSNIDVGIKTWLPQIGYHGIDVNNKFVCRSLWANMMTEPGAFHLPHIHGSGQTVFSGVYWPTSGLNEKGKPLFPEEKINEAEEDVFAQKKLNPGDLVFYDPAFAVKRQIIPKGVQDHEFYGGSIVVRPRESKLVIFPNYLTHMVVPFTKKQTRISISFSFEAL